MNMGAYVRRLTTSIQRRVQALIMLIVNHCIHYVPWIVNRPSTKHIVNMRMRKNAPGGNLQNQNEQPR